MKTPRPGPGDGSRGNGGEGRPLVSYEPNALLAWVYGRFFESIEVDESWARAVREADSRGTVVYVLRNLSFVDFFALDYLTKRHHLPQIRFANDLGLWILEPMGRGWLNALRPRTVDGDAADLERAVSSGASAALFLKRRPQLLPRGARGRIEGDHLIRALFDVQRRSPGRVLLVPQVFVWSRSAGSGGGVARRRALRARASGRATSGRSRSFSRTGATPRCAPASPSTSPSSSTARTAAPATTCSCAA